MLLNNIIFLLLIIIIIIYLFSNSNNYQKEISYSEQECSIIDLEKKINEFEKIWIIANLDMDKISCENSLKNIILSEDVTPNLIADCSDLIINNNLMDNINNLNIFLDLYKKSDINIVNYNTNSKILTGYKWEDKNLPTYFDKTKFILDNSLSLKYLYDININELTSNQTLTFILITNVNKYAQNDIDYNKQQYIYSETKQENSLVFNEEEENKKKYKLQNPKADNTFNKLYDNIKKKIIINQEQPLFLSETKQQETKQENSLVFNEEEEKYKLQNLKADNTFNKIYDIIKEKIIINQEQPLILSPLPIDCELSQWTDFGKCSTECGGGEQKRTRKIKTNAEFNGKKCSDVLEETKKCNTHLCQLTSSNIYNSIISVPSTNTTTPSTNTTTPSTNTTTPSTNTTTPSTNTTTPSTNTTTPSNINNNITMTPTNLCNTTTPVNLCNNTTTLPINVHDNNYINSVKINSLTPQTANVLPSLITNNSKVTNSSISSTNNSKVTNSSISSTNNSKVTNSSLPPTNNSKVTNSLLPPTNNSKVTNSLLPPTNNSKVTNSSILPTNNSEVTNSSLSPINNLISTTKISKNRTNSLMPAIDINLYNRNLLAETSPKIPFFTSTILSKPDEYKNDNCNCKSS